MTIFTITDKQISSIHNAMCSMYWLDRTVSEMFKSDSDMVYRVSEVRKYLEPVRDELMKLKDAHEDKIRKLADALAIEHRFTNTIWSIYEIDSFLDETDIPVGSWITSEFNSKAVEVEGFSEKATWLDLWKAAEKLASLNGDSGFGNHVFIEKFHKDSKKENTYDVWLGS